MNLQGNTILITGGASGIGKGLVNEFYQHKNKIIVIGRSQSKLDSLQSEFPNIIIKKIDLSQKDEVDLLIQYCIHQYPEINILVNNAGVEYNYMYDKNIKEDKIIEETQVNFTAPILLINGLIPLLSNKNEAAIVNVTSVLVFSAKINAAVYSGTKAGLRNFTIALREQFKNSNIKIFELIPPLTDTPLTESNPNKKISVQQLSKEFINAFRKDKKTIYIGYSIWIYYLYRFFPRFLNYLVHRRYVKVKKLNLNSRYNK